MDAAAHRLMYEHLRWLDDREVGRLASIEGRASAVVGWCGTQVSIGIGVIALADRFADSLERTLGLVLLLLGLALLSLAVITTVALVLSTRTVSAPSVDLAVTRGEMSQAGDVELEAHLAEALSASIAVDELKAVVDQRATALRRSTWLVSAAVVAHAAAGLLLLIATIGATP